MAWTTPRTWVPGELVTASMLNIHLRDNINFIFGMLSNWNTVAFSAGNFTAVSGTWTVGSGDVAYNKFLLHQNAIFWQLTVSGATPVASGPSQLLVAIPAIGRGFASVASRGKCDLFNDNGTFVNVTVSVYDATHIVLAKDTTSLAVSMTGPVSFHFQKFFELTP